MDASAGWEPTTAPWDLLAKRPKKIPVDLLQEPGELGLRQPVVERLVLRVQPGERVEAPQQVCDRLDPPASQGLDQGADQALRRDVAQCFDSLGGLPVGFFAGSHVERIEKRAFERPNSDSWTSGWPPRVSSIVFAPLSRISRAVMLLPRASLGSEI